MTVTKAIRDFWTRARLGISGGEWKLLGAVAEDDLVVPRRLESGGDVDLAVAFIHLAKAGLVYVAFANQEGRRYSITAAGRTALGGDNAD